MAVHEGKYKGSIRKKIEFRDLKAIADRHTDPDSVETVWRISESRIPRTWESWLITTLPDNADWTAAIRLEPDSNGEMVAAELRVFPSESFDGDADEDPRIRGEWSRNLDAIPEGGLGVRDLRSLRLASHVRVGGRAATDKVAENAELLQAHAERLGNAMDPKIQTWLEALPPPPVASSGRGRRIPDLDYANIAARYLHHHEAGSERPAVETANELGNGWTADKVREWLRRARQRRLLTNPGHGKPGGRLTPEAEQILRESQTKSPTGD
jgi:hypothetical protein